MSSLAATLLAQSSGTVRTRQALIVTGLQNDFIAPEGKLPMSTQSGFIDRIKELVPAFREHGNIIWVWTEYRGNRSVNDPSGTGCMVMIPEEEHPAPAPETDPSREDRSSSLSGSYPHATRRNNQAIQRAMRLAAELDLEEDADADADADANELPAGPPSISQDPELFLSETSAREACCKPGTWGAEPIPEIKDLIDPRDIHITKSYYSAFTSTSLLLQLRAKLVTDLYFAGCNTNLSVYATATDVARHGLEINIVQDCLGCRQMDRHDKAVSNMVSFMGAEVTTAHSVMARLRGEEVPDDHSSDNDDDSDDEEYEDLDEEYEPPTHTGPVRYSFMSTDQSEDSMLSEAISSTAASNNALTTNVAPTEHAEPDSNEPAADTGRYSFIRGAEEYQYQEATADDRLGRRHIDTTEDLNATHRDGRTHETNQGEQEVSAGETGLTTPLRQLSADDDFMQHERVTGQPLSRNAALPLVAQTGIHGSLQSTINPPIVPLSTASGTWNSAADVAGENSLARTIRRPFKKKSSWQPSMSILGSGDVIGSGDSSIVFDLLPPTLSNTIFPQLLHEVHWQRMYHAAGEVPRLVCCEGDVDTTDGSMPVYRHPSDHSLPLLHWSPGVARVRREAERRVGHRLNHVLIQLYRSGQDYISEHSDKTLDIVPGSSIVNVSFGAQRTMRLRTKRAAPSTENMTPTSEGQATDAGTAEHAPPTHAVPAQDAPVGPQRTTQRMAMPHNSMFVMGQSTNAAWLHGITPDKRIASERSASELAYNGARISLTFRNIGTYLSSDTRQIWGQGATSKDKRTANSTINGHESSSQAMIDAFGFENQSTTFDWHGTYGQGFDVLHLKRPPPNTEDTPLLFLSGDEHADLAVKLYLAHLGVQATEVASATPSVLSSTSNARSDADVDTNTFPTTQRLVALRDTDTLHTQTSGAAAILLYLDRAYARYLLASSSPAMLAQAAREAELLTSSLLAELRDLLRQSGEVVGEDVGDVAALRELDDFMQDCGGRDGGGGSGGGGGSEIWLAGKEFGIADCAFWSVVQACRVLFSGFGDEFPALSRWASRVQAREEVGLLRRGGAGAGAGVEGVAESRSRSRSRGWGGGDGGEKGDKGGVL